MDTQDYKKLLEDSKQYVNTRYELLKLELLDKLSQIIGIIIMVLVVALLLLAGLAFFSVALISLMSIWMPTSVACCLIGMVYILLIILCLTNRQRWFITPLIGVLSGILFEETDPANCQVNEGKEAEHE